MFGDVAFSAAPFAAYPGAVYIVAISESALGDNTQSSLQSKGAVMTESASVSDEYAGRLPLSVNVSEETSIVSDLNAVRAIFGVARNELAQATSAASSLAAVLVNVSELGTAIDSESTKIFVLANRSELSTATDSQAVRRQVFSSVSDVVLAQDGVESKPNYAAIVADTVTGQVSIIALGNLRASAVETSVAADFATTNAALKASLADSITAADVSRGFLLYFVRIEELAAAFDQAGARALWEEIVDTQNPDWVIIPTTPNN